MSIVDKLPFFSASSGRYGLVIIAITIITRIFIVSIAWSYGIFLVLLRKTYPDSHFAELGWIAGLAQGLGSLLSPLFIYVMQAFGAKRTFFTGIALCCASLLASSFVPNEHWLFVTYSIPFGFGSSIIFVLGSIVTGMYYPPKHKYHVTASVAISLGFPIGFLLLNVLTEHLMLKYDSNWPLVQRLYGSIAFMCLLLFSPFFTEAKAEKPVIKSTQTLMKFRDEVPLQLSPEQFSLLIKAIWLLGLMFNSCATTAIVTHLSGYFVAIGLDTQLLNLTFVTLGLADALFRIILAVTGPYLKSNLLLCYLFQAFMGLILSLLWSNETNPLFNTVYCFLFGVCPAVVMSLMYTVNSEISGEGNIEKNYTYNVMVSGLGIIIGPALSGLLLDSSKKNYEVVFSLAAKLYLASIVAYFSVKILLSKYVKEESEEDEPCRQGYIEFSNEEIAPQ